MSRHLICCAVALTTVVSAFPIAEHPLARHAKEMKRAMKQQQATSTVSVGTDPVTDFDDVYTSDVEAQVLCNKCQYDPKKNQWSQLKCQDPNAATGVTLANWGTAEWECAVGCTSCAKTATITLGEVLPTDVTDGTSYTSASIACCPSYLHVQNHSGFTHSSLGPGCGLVATEDSSTAGTLQLKYSNYQALGCSSETSDKGVHDIDRLFCDTTATPGTVNLVGNLNITSCVQAVAGSHTAGEACPTTATGGCTSFTYIDDPNYDSHEKCSAIKGEIYGYGSFTMNATLYPDPIKYKCYSAQRDQMCLRVVKTANYVSTMKGTSMPCCPGPESCSISGAASLPAKATMVAAAVASLFFAV